MQTFDVITPKLIKSNVSEDNPRVIPVVTSCKGSPLIGRNDNSTRRPQQFINEKHVTKMYPEIK